MREIIDMPPLKYRTLAEATQRIYYLECLVGGNYRWEKELDGYYWVYKI